MLDLLNLKKISLKALREVFLRGIKRRFPLRATFADNNSNK